MGFLRSRWSSSFNSKFWHRNRSCFSGLAQHKIFSIRGFSPIAKAHVKSLKWEDQKSNDSTRESEVLASKAKEMVIKFEVVGAS